MATTNPVEMKYDEFIAWGEAKFGIDYDQLAFLEMKRRLDTDLEGRPSPMDIPDELRDVLMARKGQTEPMMQAREAEQAAAVAEAEVILATPGKWTRQQWEILVKANYARFYRDDDDSGGYYELFHRGPEGRYDDQVGIDG